MKCIIFQGVSNSGKTGIIRKIVGDYFKIEVIFPRGDFSLIFEYKKKKVGIASCGDCPYTFQKNYFLFKEKGCDYVILTSRTKGKVIRFIEKNLSEYYLINCKRNIDKGFNYRYGKFKRLFKDIFK